jgi:hypothetical protein
MSNAKQDCFDRPTIIRDWRGGYQYKFPESLHSGDAAAIGNDVSNSVRAVRARTRIVDAAKQRGANRAQIASLSNLEGRYRH